MRIFVAVAATALLVGCAKRICLSPAPFAPLAGIDSDFPADILESVNTSVLECRKSATDRQVQSCKARESEDNTRIFTNAASGLFGTAAGATGGLPALISDTGPSDAQAILSVASGGVSLAILLYSNLFSDKTKNEHIYTDAKEAWEAYHSGVIPSRDELVRARFALISARRLLAELEKTPPSNDTQKKRLEDARRAVQQAWEQALAAYLKLLTEASACSSSAKRLADQPPGDLRRMLEEMGVPQVEVAFSARTRGP